MILFDGVYMLTGIALTGVSLLASKAATLAPFKDCPFGRHAATPLAVALQGAALLGTVVYGAADGTGCWTVDDEDTIRRGSISRLETLDYQVWATVELTTDPALVD